LSRVDKGNKLRPYSDEDKVDFFIFEICVDTHYGDFYIIPMKKLIEWGYIKSDENSGLAGIRISATEPSTKHDICNYLNKFELLQ
jgi:hypothetical protein